MVSRINDNISKKVTGIIIRLCNGRSTVYEDKVKQPDALVSDNRITGTKFCKSLQISHGSACTLVQSLVIVLMKEQ